MKKFAMIGIFGAVAAVPALMFAPISLGASANATPPGVEANLAASPGAEVVSPAPGAWQRPPADASMNKFLASSTVALASAR